MPNINSNKIITAVVTNFNKPPHILRRCIDSINMYGIRYIIVDDNSDNVEHLKEYDNVILLNKNVGTYKAFEIGMETVDTGYIMRVDADDYITGKPDISSFRDAYINNIHGMITLDLDSFIKKPYAGLGGAVVKVDVLKDVWYSCAMYAADIIIFVRLVKRYDCVMNKKCLYVYDRTHSTITKIDHNIRREHLNYAKSVAMAELLYCDSIN